MKKFEYVIQDPLGIHARPAGKLVNVSKGLDSVITLEKAGGKSAVTTKPMALMGLGIKGGDTVLVTVDGGNEDANLTVMEQFFKENL